MEIDIPLSKEISDILNAQIKKKLQGNTKKADSDGRRQIE